MEHRAHRVARDRATPGARPALLAVLLIVVGFAFWGCYRLAAGGESHAYSPDAVPPDTVRVTRGETYVLSFPGGVAGLRGQGIDPVGLQCQVAQGPTAVRQVLVVDPYGQNSASRDGVASFVATVSGDVHVTCDGLGTMFVDDADDAGGDLSGWFLLLTTIALTIGAGLAMSALRRGPTGRAAAGSTAEPHASTWAAGEDDEVQRLVRMVHLRAADDEVLDPD